VLGVGLDQVNAICVGRTSVGSESTNWPDRVWYFVVKSPQNVVEHLFCGSICSLKRAMDGRIVRCGIISSLAISSAATSEIVKRFWSRTHSSKKRHSKYRPLPLPIILTTPFTM